MPRLLGIPLGSLECGMWEGKGSDTWVCFTGLPGSGPQGFRESGAASLPSPGHQPHSQCLVSFVLAFLSAAWRPPTGHTLSAVAASWWAGGGRSEGLFIRDWLSSCSFVFAGTWILHPRRSSSWPWSVQKGSKHPTQPHLPPSVNSRRVSVGTLGLISCVWATR